MEEAAMEEIFFCTDHFKIQLFKNSSKLWNWAKVWKFEFGFDGMKGNGLAWGENWSFYFARFFFRLGLVFGMEFFPVIFLSFRCCSLFLFLFLFFTSFCMQLCLILFINEIRVGMSLFCSKKKKKKFSKNW